MKRFILIVCTLFLCCLGFSQDSKMIFFPIGHKTITNVIILNNNVYALDPHVESFTVTEIASVNIDTCKVSLQGFYNNTTASISYNLYIKKGDKIQFKRAPTGHIERSLNVTDHELYELSDFTFNEMTLKILK